jgi:membrane protease YdiL (CAAX protease family)
VVDLIRRRGETIRGSTAVISEPPPRIEDLVVDVLRVGFLIVPVLLVGYLLLRDGESWATLRLDRRRPFRDVGEGAVIAALVSAVGLGFYVFAVRAGFTRTIIPVSTDGPWWTTPLLLLQAGENAVVEEVIVGAYLLHRLRQIGWRNATAIGACAVLRGSYHLYQGVGPFAANAVMGVAFALWLLRGKRTWPLVVAHFLIDAVVFVGWFWFRDHLSWLPH